MRKIKIAVCAICLLLCCGCWDKHELEDQTFAVMLGIDKADGENVIVTAAFPLTQSESGGGQPGEGGGKYTVTSVKAPTVAEGLNMFGIKLAGPLALFSVKTVVVSQELAEDDMLSHVLSSWRYEQMRSNTNLLVSNCTAAEYIEARLKDSAIDVLRQEDLLLEQANYGSYYKAVQFIDFIINLKSNSMGGIAMYGGVQEKDENEDKESEKHEIKGEVKDGYFPGEAPLKADNTSQICGLAIFRGNRMVGALNSAEAQIYAMMTQSKTRKILTLPNPIDTGSDIIATILPTGSSKIRCYFADGKPVFDIDVNLRCTVESIGGGADYTDSRNYNILTEHIKQYCAKNMQELMTKLQKEYNADILRLGDKLARTFLTVPEWESYNWQERYKDAEIRINVNLDIERATFLY